MKAYRSNSANDITYINHTHSGMALSLQQSSAHPTNLAALMRTLPLIIKQYPIDEIPDQIPQITLPIDFSALTPEERELYLYNVLNRDTEPEDARLVASGVLPDLLKQAQGEPPSSDWERELEEL